MRRPKRTVKGKTRNAPRVPAPAQNPAQRTIPIYKRARDLSLLLFMIWLGFGEGYQCFIGMSRKTWEIGCVAVVLGVIFFLFRAWSLAGGITQSVAVLVLAGWAVGSYSPMRDVVLVLTILMVFTLLWPGLRAWFQNAVLFCYSYIRRRANVTGPELEYPIKGQRGLKFAALLLLTCWLVVSAADLAWPPGPCTLNPARFAKKQGQRGVRVGVCLSGGGYRAALMHAGVLDALDTLNVPITAVSAVSGGSFIASYYDAGGDMREFRNAVKSGHFNLKRELAVFNNAVRLPLPSTNFGRVDVQANLLNARLFSDKKLRDLNGNGNPKLLICTTDLRHGWAVGLSNEGVFVHDILSSDRENDFNTRRQGANHVAFLPVSRPDDFPSSANVSKLVSYSGAFPGAFDPATVQLAWLDNESTRRWVTRETREVGPFRAETLSAGSRIAHTTVSLADGGIADNSGVVLLLDAHSLAKRRIAPPSWQVDFIISSDAGAVAPGSVTSIGPLGIQRTIDLIYAGSGPACVRSPRQTATTNRIEP
jgi:predicted acylesterase/phospholipase RssA